MNHVVENAIVVSCRESLVSKGHCTKKTTRHQKNQNIEILHCNDFQDWNHRLNSWWVTPTIIAVTLMSGQMGTSLSRIVSDLNVCETGGCCEAQLVLPPHVLACYWSICSLSQWFWYLRSSPSKRSLTHNTFCGISPIGLTSRMKKRCFRLIRKIPFVGLAVSTPGTGLGGCLPQCVSSDRLYGWSLWVHESLSLTG